jgi:hypothetical protein
MRFRIYPYDWGSVWCPRNSSRPVHRRVGCLRVRQPYARQRLQGRLPSAFAASAVGQVVQFVRSVPCFVTSEQSGRWYGRRPQGSVGLRVAATTYMEPSASAIEEGSYEENHFEKGTKALKRLQVFPVLWQRRGHRQPVDRGGRHPEEPRHRPTRRCLGMWGGCHLSPEIVKLFWNLRPPLRILEGAETAGLSSSPPRTCGKGDPRLAQERRCAPKQLADRGLDDGCHRR